MQETQNIESKSLWKSQAIKLLKNPPWWIKGLALGIVMIIIFEILYLITGLDRNINIVIEIIGCLSLGCLVFINTKKHRNKQ
jgi:hypothetical protein